MGMGIRQQIYDLTALSLRPRHCKEDETLLLDSSHPVKVGCTLKIVDYGQQGLNGSKHISLGFHARELAMS